jgi:hypothetical protein
VSSPTPPDFYNRGALLARGWTMGLIQQLLGGPDYFVANPHNGGFTTIGLYAAARVAKAEGGPRFTAFRARKAAARPPGGGADDPKTPTRARTRKRLPSR